MLYVSFSPSRYVNPASWIDFRDATLASSLVPVQCASLAPPAKTVQKNPCDYKGHTHSRLAALASGHVEVFFCLSKNACSRLLHVLLGCNEAARRKR